MRLDSQELFNRIKRKNFNTAANLDAFIAAPGVNQVIVVMGYVANASGGVNTITPLAGATVGGGVALDGLPPIELADSGGIVLTPPWPVAELPTNVALSIGLGALTQVAGCIYYALAPA